MSSSTRSHPRVDAGALGGAVYGEAVDALASAVVLAMDWSEEEGFGLNQKQKIKLVYAALCCSSNLEASMTKTIVDDLEGNGVEAWGLSDDFEQLLGRKES